MNRPPWRRPHKFGAKRTVYGGRSYASKAEASYAERLDYLLRAGEIASWKPQPNLDVRINGRHVFWFRPDFAVKYPDGSLELVEIKGWVAPGDGWHVRRRVFEATYLVEFPQVRYRVLNRRFQPWEMPKRKKKPAGVKRPAGSIPF